MHKTVCILAAGKGTRMGTLTKHLNKAILPYGKKAIISHIIDMFPKDYQFVIALGYEKEKTQTYITMAHPDINITFVEVNNYNGINSGPGYSLSLCKEQIPGSFYFVACDTLWEEIDLNSQNDWFGVSTVPVEESHNYCNFEINNDIIMNIHDKEIYKPNCKSFIGLGYIKNYNEFWIALSNSNKNIMNEIQVSFGISALLPFAPEAKEIKWTDLGTYDKYVNSLKTIEDFNFSKPEESLYIINDRVIKFFANPELAAKRVTRSKTKSNIFPETSSAQHGFYYYPLVSGNTLYKYCTPKLFRQLLEFLDKNLWSQVTVDDNKFLTTCEKFYKTKTEERLKLYLNKYNEGPLVINGIDVPSITILSNKIPWDNIYNGLPVIFHGDLQFDNILYNKTEDKFTLLDWRQDFGGEVEFGDLYYDLAKLNGGLNLQYDLIKKGLFYYEETDEQIIDYAKRLLSDEYIKILKQFANSKGLDWHKIEMITAIIYLNMSPLHEYPFDKLLFALGKLKLHQELNLGQ